MTAIIPGLKPPLRKGAKIRVNVPEGGGSDLALVRDQIPPGDEPLDPAWLPLVWLETNGYRKLALYLRVIKAQPSDRALYQELSELLGITPENIQGELRPWVIEELYAIQGIRRNYLVEYGLDTIDDSTVN